MLSVCSKSYWDDIASSFAALGPPLRPSAEDIGLWEKTVVSWTAGHPSEQLRAMLLGVTPEIAEMQWPEAWSLMAIDQSIAMAQVIWPGDIPRKRWAVCGDWLALPRRDSSCAVVVGDGSMNCVRYPDGARALAENVRDVLRPDGLLLLRCFVQLPSKENPEEVFSDLLQLRIPSFQHFKFRLLMAMQPSAREGIVLNDVYEEWVNRRVDEDWLMARTGWEKRSIATIDMYRDKDVVHAFPTLAEFRAVLHEFFDEVAISNPSYCLGERCPRLVLRPRKAGATR